MVIDFRKLQHDPPTLSINGEVVQGHLKGHFSPIARILLLHNLVVGTFPKEHAGTVIETYFFQLLLGY